MTAPLSQDLRRRLIRAVEAGSSASEAARRFEVSASAAIKLVRRVRETGSTAPAQIGGYRKPLLAGHEAVLRELKELDQIAYVRFASVYRQFADLADLRREVEGLSDIPVANRTDG